MGVKGIAWSASALAILLTGTALSLIGDGLAQRFGQNRRGLM